MAELKTRIQLLRKSREWLESKNPITLPGEIYIVDCGENQPLRFKIGDGNTFKSIKYYDDDNGIIVRGYYLNGIFYTDSTYTTKLEESISHIYIDANTNEIYTWDGTKYNRDVDQATDTKAGIMKLYQSAGQNIDGTMSQKIVTDGVNSIKFAVDQSESECLVLDLPWD